MLRKFDWIDIEERDVVRTLGDKSSIEKRAKNPVTHMPSRGFVGSVAFMCLVHKVVTGKLNGLKEWVREGIQGSLFRKLDDGKRVEKLGAAVQMCKN